MSDDAMDDQAAEKDSGQIVTWYGLLIGVYLSKLDHDEVRRFICLEMATQVAPGKEAVKHAQEYERFLRGASLKAVDEK